MPLNRTLKAVAVAAIATCGAVAYVAAQQTPSRRPNILFIISDDIGLDTMTNVYPGLVDDLSKKYGPSGLKHPNAATIQGRPASTPNLNQLAKQGVAFSNVWAQPFCSPTRASILTGLFAGKAGVLSYADPLAQRYTSVAKKLKDEAGYSTGIFGKWHLAGLPGAPVNYPGMKPKEAGFEIFRGNMHAAIRTYWEWDYQVQDAATPDGQWRTEPAPSKSLPGIAPTTFASVVNAADALEWIGAKEKENPNKPWFAWVAFNLAHATAQQKPSAMAVPNLDTLDAPSAAEMKACGGQFGSANVGTCSDRSLQRAMTNALDTLVGKLLTQVDALDPNTYVIFIGDNGTPMYGRPNLDFIDNMYITTKGRGKGTAYESGARVPLVVRGPDIRKAARNDDYVHAADLFSTILSLAGLSVPSQVPDREGTLVAVDGVSLSPILFNKASTVRDPNRGYLLTESLNLMTQSTRQVGARNATYKVVCTEKVNNAACEFYNLANDPLEEYPLPEPDSCSAYTAGTWTPADPRWHYCRLTEIVDKDSFI